MSPGIYILIPTSMTDTPTVTPNIYFHRIHNRVKKLNPKMLIKEFFL